MFASCALSKRIQDPPKKPSPGKGLDPSCQLINAKQNAWVFSGPNIQISPEGLVTGWSDPDTVITYEVGFRQTGRLRVLVSAEQGSGSVLAVRVNGLSFDTQAVFGCWAQEVEAQGEFQVDRDYGYTQVEVRGVSKTGQEFG